MFIVRSCFIEWNIWVKIPMSKQAVLYVMCLHMEIRQMKAASAIEMNAITAVDALGESF